MKSNFILVILFSLLLSNITFAQIDDNKDFAIWNSVGIKYSPIKKLSFGVEQHLRLKESASETDEYFTEVAAEFELIKNLEIAQSFRFIRENDNVGKKQGYEKHFRFSTDISYNFDVKKFNLFYRLRYQNKRELGLEDNTLETPVETLRFKAGVEYNIVKWPLDPKIAVEIFNRKRENYSLISGAKLSRYRITLGTSYNLKKFGKFGIYYRFQENTRPDNTFQTTILGFKYSYSIK